MFDFLLLSLSQSDELIKWLRVNTKGEGGIGGNSDSGEGEWSILGSSRAHMMWNGLHLAWSVGLFQSTRRTISDKVVFIARSIMEAAAEVAQAKLKNGTLANSL